MDWSLRRNFLWVSSPGLHTLSREKFVSSSHKYQGRVEFWMLFKLLHTKQLNTALKTATSSHHFILGGKCAQAGIEQDRFGLVENTVPFNIRKFRKFKPGFLVKWNAPLVSNLCETDIKISIRFQAFQIRPYILTNASGDWLRPLLVLTAGRISSRISHGFYQVSQLQSPIYRDFC